MLQYYDVVKKLNKNIFINNPITEQNHKDTRKRYLYDYLYRSGSKLQQSAGGIILLP